MSVTTEELDRFHDFASSLVSGPESDITWPQLFEAWCLQNPSAAEYEENVAAIQESLDAMDAGRMRPFFAFDAEFDFELRQALFKTRHGVPYRCVFTVVDDEVRILRVRGPGQAPLNAGDIVER